MQTGQVTPGSRSILTVDVQIDILPPGLSTLNISLNAFYLFGARQNAPLEITISIELSGSGLCSMSATTNFMLSPRCTARISACFTSYLEMSSPITFPVYPA
jgi:hypothetical protein